MKLKVIVTMLLAAGLYMSCTRDLEVSEAEFSDFGVITSEFRSDAFTSGINNFVTFNDISINAVEHTWTIEEGSFFIEGPLDRNDTILKLNIIEGAGLVSTEKTVNVLFTEGGLKTVNLRNAFRDSVSFRTSLGDIPSRREGDLFVIDTTFVVDVYDTIVPVIDIRQNGISVPFADSLDVIEIEAGDFLEFVDLSTKDRVTDRAWRVEENGVATDSIGVFVFKKLGDFKAVADLTRQGANIPFSFARYEIPATFRVIPSTKPFELAGEVIELEDQTILVPFNGEFAPFGGQEDFFSATLNNDPSGMARPLAIASVGINAEDATILEIKFSEPIFRSDDITVSYNGSGTLQSTDTRSPVAFTDVPVTMFSESAVPEELQDIYDFEGLLAEEAWSARGDNVGGSFSLSTERASSGTSSLKIEGDGSGTVRFICGTPIEGLPDGEYTIAFDMFIETDNGGFNAIWPTIGNPFFQQWRDLRAGQGIPRGEWFTVVSTNPVNGGTLAEIAVRIEGGANGVAFIDNWRLLEVETRP